MLLNYASIKLVKKFGGVLAVLLTIIANKVMPLELKFFPLPRDVAVFMSREAFWFSCIYHVVLNSHPIANNLIG